MFIHRVLAQLRREPALYRMVRRLYRGSFAIPREILRILAPSHSRFGPPKGQFSALTPLDAGEIRGRVAWRGQETPKADPDSMIVRCGFEQDQHQPWPAFWAGLGSVQLVGESRMPVNGSKLVCTEAIYGWFDRHADCNYFALPPATRLAGPWVSLDSAHFYHWFHECVPRLWAMQDLPPETGILIPDHSPEYVWDTLRWLGLENRARPTSERHIVVEEYYFLSPTVFQGCLNPRGLHYLRENFLIHADRSRSTPKRIYLSRVGQARSIQDEGVVEAFFRDRGWTVIVPESLSMAQQIALFADAEAVCGPHGAAFSNLVWCSPGCRVLELFAEGFLNGCYEGIALCLDLSYRWLVFPADGKFRARVDLGQVEAALDSMGV